MPEAAHENVARRLSRKDSLFLDFDGTLAPLADDPSTVFMTARTEAAVAAACGRAGAVMILSGRDGADLDARTPRFLWRAARHGLLIAPPGAALGAGGAAPTALAAAFDAVARGVAGARLETKGEVLAVHFRKVPAAGPAVVLAAQRAVEDFEDYVVQVGKCVVEAKPSRANKGLAIARLMEKPPFAGLQPLYIGDDATDEDAFMTVNRAGGLSVKVGEGETAAKARLPSPDAVTLWLEEAAA